MIDVINYSDRLKIYIFDEPIKQYHELMLMAASDNTNDLSNNYRKDILSSQLFMTLYEIDGEPAEMFGLYQEEWMKQFNVARGYSRTYKNPKFRDTHFKSEYSKILDGKLLLNFYNENSHYLEKFNIQSVFFTRNYETGKKNSMERVMRLWNPLYVTQKDVYVYKKTPQYFYVMGDTSFLSFLEKLDHK